LAAGDRELNKKQRARRSDHTQAKPNGPTCAKAPSCYLLNLGERNTRLRLVALAVPGPGEGICAERRPL
jgi:hypothetical protein